MTLPSILKNGSSEKNDNTCQQALASLAKSTFDSKVLSDFRSFTGLYGLGNRVGDDPVLAAVAEQLGDKLYLALEAARLDGLGQDLAAMVLNKIAAQGARPLFFLNCLVASARDSRWAVTIIAGLAEACKKSSCVLLGGDAHSAPDSNPEFLTSLSGFAVGLVERDLILDGSAVTLDGKIIGVASSGLHAHGLLEARRLIASRLGPDLKAPFLGATVAEVLLEPSRLYANTIMAVLKRVALQAAAPVGNGGLFGSITQILPRGCQVVLERDSWPLPPVFDFLSSESNWSLEELYSLFNMGVGLVLVSPSGDAETVLSIISAYGEKAAIIGEIKRSSSGGPAISVV